MAASLQLVPATAGKHLGAAVVDWLPPLAVLVVTHALGIAGITRMRSGGLIIHNTASLVLFGGIGLGLTLVYLLRMGRNPGGQAPRVPAIVTPGSSVHFGHRTFYLGQA